MGNQLSGTAPVQMHPVEYYLSDISNSELISFDNNLGSTRFFKVARVKLHQIRPQLIESNSYTNYSGFDAPSLGLAKVFVINDPTLPLKYHQAKIDTIKSLLKENLNFLPFNKIIINDKAAILLRQYVKYNLYDRLSTRPFLTLLEKRWIAFQLLKCCDWMHSKGICHGDIKLENILITSSLWLLLTDFATYKPVYLPEDNPADFSYFFDTSRRRTCNLAPERFVFEGYSQNEPTSSGNLNSTLLGSVENNYDELVATMDLFSIGCVLAELFTEDSSDGCLFDLSALLMYRANDKSFAFRSKVIDSIQDDQIKQVIFNLIELDPNERKLAGDHLKFLTSSVFPAYFEDLYKYVKRLITLSPDEKITHLFEKLDFLLKLISEEDSSGFLLIIVIVTSCLRSLKHVHVKILALRLLCKLINCDVRSLSSFILDRILPYLIVMLKDEDARVRSEAIESLTLALSNVEKVPQSDNNIFPDYLLPCLSPIAKDKSLFVRISLAQNLAELASVSIKFLNNTCQEKNYTTELTVLQNSFQNMVSTLLTDVNSNVKIALLSSDISKLCSFFGNQKANEVILSHVFTFLNEKDETELRCAFFESIVPIAKYFGLQCSPLLKPLLQQGISDHQEIVIFKTISSLSQLVNLKLLENTIAFEILTESTALLIHPNIWIRHSIISFIHLFAGQLSLAEICCKLIPLVNPYLTKEVFMLSNVNLLMDSLKSPLQRWIYNFVINPNNEAASLNKLFDCLKERKRLRSQTRHHEPSQITSEKLALNCPLFQRILSEFENKTLNEEQEEKILQLSSLAKKIHKNFQWVSASNQNLSNRNIILMPKKYRKTHSILLSDQVRKFPVFRNKSSLSSVTNMNEEWQTMFASQKDSIETSQEILDVTNDGDGEIGQDLNIPFTQEVKNGEEDTCSLNMCPPCINDLNNLINHKKNYFLSLRSSNSMTELFPISCSITSSSYRPKGLLLAHLHEHTDAINRITTIHSSSLFVTCSSDSTVKIWEPTKIEREATLINKSRQTFKLSIESEAFKGVVYCSGTGSLITYTNNNNLYFLKVDPYSSKVKLDHKELNVCGDNKKCAITDITCLSPYLFATSTSNSVINGYDLRQPFKSAFELNLSPGKGLITCINGTEYTLFAATSAGLLVNYDLRFGLRVGEMNYTEDYKYKKRIRRILYAPNGLYSSIQGNNEVILWDCGSRTKAITFWASDVPALSQVTKDSLNRSVLGLISINSHNMNSLITCGTDRKIRYWDLNSPQKSFIISDSYKPPPEPSIPSSIVRSYYSNPSVVYESKLMEGMQVIQEHSKKIKKPTDYSSFLLTPPSSANLSISNSLIWDQQTVSLSHRTCITDIAWLHNLNYIVSVSSDGSVKVWK